MKYTPTKIPGVMLIDLEPKTDERGFFARTWDATEAKRAGCDLTIVQCNVSFNQVAGTLRGMHYQEEPYGESKVVRCTQGAIYDVALDLRVDSPTYREWVAAELSAKNRSALFIPRGCAHGFQTLEDDTEISYLMGAAYNPEAARGVRWDDAAFGITWPATTFRTVSEKDRSYPDWAI